MIQKILLKKLNGGQISKITAGTTAESLLNGINEGLYCGVYSGDKLLDGNAAIGTGMAVRIMDGDNVLAEVITVVTGDINGDGNINETDRLSVETCIMKKSTSKGVYAAAADINADGVISIPDFIHICMHLSGRNPIAAH